MVTVQRLAAALATTPATMTELTAPTMTMTAPAAHALHVHLYRVSLFRLRQFRAQRASTLIYVLKSESVTSKRCQKGCINKLPFGIREGNRTSALTAPPFYPLCPAAPRVKSRTAQHQGAWHPTKIGAAGLGREAGRPGERFHRRLLALAQFQHRNTMGRQQPG